MGNTVSTVLLCGASRPSVQRMLSVKVLARVVAQGGGGDSFLGPGLGMLNITSVLS